MRFLRTLLLLVGMMLLSVGPLSAQHRGGGHFGGHRFHGGFGGFGGFGNCGFLGSGSVFSPSVFASPPFVGYGYGYYGYPSHFPPYPYPAPLPQQPQYTTVIAEPSHDWRNWSPTSKVIVETPTKPSDARVIGMGVPQWAANNSEPLGDVARRYRVLAAQARSKQRVVIAQNQ